MGRINDQVCLEDSGVIPGTYTNANIVVDRKGIIISATNGGTGTGTGAPAALNDLTDVTASGPLDCSVIKFDAGSSMWVSQELNLNLLKDVTLAGTPAVGDVLSFNGTTWQNFDLSTAGVLTAADIGVTVQGWADNLDGLGAMGAGTGYVVQTGANTFAKRQIQIVPGSGLTLSDGDGIAANTMIGIDIISAPMENQIQPDCDSILFYDDSVNAVRSTNMQTLLSHAPITGVTNTGAGAGLFTGIVAQDIQLRTILSGCPNLTINTTAQEIVLGLSTELEDLANLIPLDCGFIVGDSMGNWIVKTDQDARDCLNLGTMAVRSETDFLPVAGGTMFGDINMGTNFIQNLMDPINAQDAATKAYVDSQIGAGASAGDGMTQSGAVFNIQSLDGSILVNTDDIQINTAFTDNLYYRKTELNNDTAGLEGAALVGTDMKVGLDNAMTVEAALEHINTELPFAVRRYSQDITGTWNLDVGAPNVQVDTRFDVEIARFEAGADTAIYKDLLLPPDFIPNRPLHLYCSFRKETATADQYDMALAFQHQRAPGFGINDIKSSTVTTTDIVVLDWVIPAGSFLPLDTITLRLSRLGANPSDTHATGVEFFASYLIQD